MKKFYRTKERKMLLGMCSGLGAYFNIDPIIFRLVFIALTLAYPAYGLGLYIVAALITPFERPESN